MSTSSGARWVPGDAKPMSPDSRVEKWKRWLESQIRAEVLGMNRHRDVYRTVAKIVNDHGALPASHFFDFLADTYGTTQAIAVRRQAEVDPQVISLGSLLSEIAADPERLSRERFLSHYDSLDQRHGEREWDEKFAGGVGDHVDPEGVRADVDELATATRTTKDLVDKHLAHTDKKPLPSPPTFEELNAAIDTINALFQKYVLLLTVSSLCDPRTGSTVRLARDLPRTMD